MKITRISNFNFTAYCDAFAIKSYCEQVYFLSLTGAVSAVQSIYASLLSNRPVILEHEYTQDISLPYKVKFKSIHKRLPSRQQHLILYPEIALPDNASNEFLILVKDESSAPETFFKYLNRRVTVPLHKSWDKWLWDIMREDNSVEELTAEGLRAYLCLIDQDDLAEQVTTAVRSKELTIDKSCFPKTDAAVESKNTSGSPDSVKINTNRRSSLSARNAQAGWRLFKVKDPSQKIIPENRQAR